MISIIIPVYNAEAYLAKCLDSVLEQTYKDFEVILIDDKSTDDSFNIGHSYAKADRRIDLWTRPKNVGVGASRNFGIKEARGDLLFFLDADDFLMPTTLETLYNGREKHGCPVTIGGAFKVTPLGNFYKTTHFMKTGLLHEKEIIKIVVDYLFTHDDYAVSHCWGRLYEKEFIKFYNIKFVENLKVGEDGAFNVRCLSFADSVLILDDLLYCFRIHENSSSVRAIKNNVLDLDPLKKELNKFFSLKVALSMGELKHITEAWGKKYE